MSNCRKPDDRSAFFGGALVLLGFFIKFAVPEPYNDIAGKVLIGIIALVIISFFAFTFINEKKVLNSKEQSATNTTSSRNSSINLDAPLKEFDHSKYKDNLRKNLPRDIFIFLIVIVASVILVCYVILPKLDLPDIHFGSSNAKPAPTLSTSSQSSILQYYQHNYPQTWGYISKYADDPFNYLQYYHSVWGRLQVYHGDGIPFGTLTAFEQRLVSYPPIKSYIYLATGQTTYHSTPDCYTLLRSDVYAEPSKYFSFYEPCSKCVGE